MHPHPTVIGRAIRAFTAVVTVWCLGCAGYEPLLDALLGATPGMVMSCSGDEQSAPVGSTDRVSDTGQQATASATVGTHAGFDCGCGSCHATSPLQLTTPSPTQALRTVVQLRPMEPASVSRTPLLPPPQSVT